MAEQKKSTTPRKSSTTGKEAKPKAAAKAAATRKVAPKAAATGKAAPKAAASKSSTPRARKNSINEEMRLRMVREAAYYRALNRGFNGGAEQEDWFAAEHEIDVMLGKLTS